ncbi:MAG: undecaprenyl/decaprenyl-phosphate alpha-N-acetylglucosaminyl 1-phosphate transferase [Pirellulales bacterium]|nr:undecaprenyl/decaprenyl-phosphate alpha-N-acetylglucosaminyl 1-phosphate transferase [Pirellulales bacterium]
MIWLVLGTIVPSLLICFSGAWLVRLFGPPLGLVDRPGGRKIHADTMPTSGGLAIWLGVVVPFALGQIMLWMIAGRADGALPGWVPEFAAMHVGGLMQQSGRLWTLLAGGTVLMLLGLVDDRRGLNWKTRILIQTFVALVMVLLGWRLSLFVDMPLMTGAISVLWIVGLVNSFNMLDNMDGLAAGVAAIAAAMLAVVMLTPAAETDAPQLFVGGFLLVLVGSLLGFLIHNRPPARIFMGDAGSYLVGYFIAMATLSATFAGDNVPRHAILAPLCVLAVPLYDTATVIFIRLREGRSPFEGDKSHFSHRLVELGMSKTQAVATIYLTTATCGLGALLLHQVNLFGAAIVLLLIGCVLLLVAVLETTGLKDSKRRSNKDGDHDD